MDVECRLGNVIEPGGVKQLGDLTLQTESHCTGFVWRVGANGESRIPSVALAEPARRFLADVGWGSKFASRQH